MTQPGEPLLLSDDPLTLSERYSQWREDSGLPSSSVVAEPVCAVPLVVKRHSGWPEGINPELLWHPLFWLPDRVAYRYRFVDEDGNERIESDDEWATRLSLELSMNGAYDTDTGTWLDVLSLIGLDIEQVSTVDKVSHWLAGNPDEDLDSIDLTTMFTNPDDVDWAASAVADLMPALKPASWALTADRLTQAAGDVFEAAQTLDEAKSMSVTVVELASAVLGDLDDPDVDWAAFSERITGHPGDLDEFRATILDEVSETLYAIRDEYWPFLESLKDDPEEEEEPVAE